VVQIVVAKTENVLARDEMDAAAFDAMMQRGLEEAKAGKGVPLEEAFAILQRVATGARVAQGGDPYGNGQTLA
jgi:predicted transcriptional regulator